MNAHARYNSNLLDASHWILYSEGKFWLPPAVHIRSFFPFLVWASERPYGPIIIFFSIKPLNEVPSKQKERDFFLGWNLRSLHDQYTFSWAENRWLKSSYFLMLLGLAFLPRVVRHLCVVSTFLGLAVSTNINSSYIHLTAPYLQHSLFPFFILI